MLSFPVAAATNRDVNFERKAKNFEEHSQRIADVGRLTLLVTPEVSRAVRQGVSDALDEVLMHLIVHQSCSFIHSNIDSLHCRLMN